MQNIPEMELEEIDLNSSEQQNVDHSSKPPESFPIVTGTMHYNDFFLKNI